MYKLYQRFWVMDSMISIFFFLHFIVVFLINLRTTLPSSVFPLDQLKPTKTGCSLGRWRMLCVIILFIFLLRCWGAWGHWDRGRVKGKSMKGVWGVRLREWAGGWLAWGGCLLFPISICILSQLILWTNSIRTRLDNFNSPTRPRIWGN